MANEVELDLRGNLRKSWIDGICYMLMVGLGEHYLPAFVLAIGLGPIFSGWVATLPMLAGSILQLATPELVVLSRSHRRWVVASATIQALVFVPLCIAAWHGSASATWIFALATAYWASGLATGPAWMTWMSTLVPTRIRARYFAKRNRALWVAFVLCFVFAGGFLEFAKANGFELGAFAVLFALAGAARLGSARYLSLQEEPHPIPREHRNVPRLELLSRFFGHGHGRLLIALFAVQASVQVAAPFFTAFMREKLEFSYATYALLYATPFAARIVALTWIGEFAHRRGARWILWFGGLVLVPVALPWTISSSVIVLFIAQAASGVGLAAFELGTFLAFFESVDEGERTSVYALYNVVNALSFAIGSTLGGLLLGALGEDRRAYAAVFVLSTCLRVAVVPLIGALKRSEAVDIGAA